MQPRGTCAETEDATFDSRVHESVNSGLILHTNRSIHVPEIRGFPLVNNNFQYIATRIVQRVVIETWNGTLYVPFSNLDCSPVPEGQFSLYNSQDSKT